MTKIRKKEISDKIIPACPDTFIFFGWIDVFYRAEKLKNRIHSFAINKTENRLDPKNEYLKKFHFSLFTIPFSIAIFLIFLFKLGLFSIRCHSSLLIPMKKPHDEHLTHAS